MSAIPFVMKLIIKSSFSAKRLEYRRETFKELVLHFGTDQALNMQNCKGDTIYPDLMNTVSEHIKWKF